MIYLTIWRVVYHCLSPISRAASIVLDAALDNVQEALGHRNRSTTRVHVRRVARKRDKHSRRISNMTTSEAHVIEETALAIADRRDAALHTAVEVWASASTSGTARRRGELMAKKRKAVESFFAAIGKDPGEATPLDVQE
jgi:hypothetical protein